MRKKLVIFGAREFAEVIAYYFDHDSPYELVAFTVDGTYVDSDRFCDRPVVAFEELAVHFSPEECDIFVAVSYQKGNRTRAHKVAAAGAAGFSLAHFVSSNASVWSGFEPRPNTFVMEHNVVQPFTTIGDNTILWAGNHIGHHTAIGDNCFIASHVVISGQVKIGDNTFIGVNATLRDGISIGKANIIGAGALIMGDTQDEQVYLAAPAELRAVPSSRLRT